MNDETNNDPIDERPLVPEVDDAADQAAEMVNLLQDEVDGLRAQLETARGELAELRNAPPAFQAAPAGDAELQALAATYRTAVRNGHPDAPKHLEALLAALGA